MSPKDPARFTSLSVVVLATLSSIGTAAFAQADATRGKSYFQTACSACHSAAPAQNGVGPTLSGVVGRKAGSAPGFTFTPALSASGLTWDPKSLDDYLTDPAKKVPGTAMAASIPAANDRADLIAYLATLKAAPAAADAKPAATPKLGLVKGPTQAELDAASTSRRDWLYASKDYAGQRYVDLDQINVKNAAQLRAHCIYRSSTATPAQTNPIVYQGMMYLTLGRQTVAIDAKTCREKWTHNWQPKGHEISPTNRGAAIKDGKLVRGTADGSLIALDLGSGQLLWSREIASSKSNQYLSMPPLIYQDMVIYGPAGADFGQKAWVGAFKLADGQPVWRFNLVPDDGEPGAETWKDAKSRAHGGGSLWTPLALDTKKGLLYLPVGNPAPDFYGEVRPGDNLYTNSVVVLDVATGKLKWYHQAVAKDVHDSDLSQISPLFTATVKGKRRDLVTLSGKDGLLRVLDRDTREVLYQLPITTLKNVDAPPTVEGTHRCPGLLGGMEWNGPAYSPRNNTLFVGAVDWCGTFTKFDAPPPQVVAEHYYGGSVVSDPREQAKGWLTAIDAATGKVRWKNQWNAPAAAGIVSTRGGVLFTGDMDNNFLAIDERNGKVLYQFNTGGSLGGGVVSYELDGNQYVGVVSGVVSGFFGGTGLPTVIVFGLH
jgi:alcohol dehydrogenase (cytochrome c)